MPRFTRATADDARAFLDSVYSRGGAITGRGARSPRTWSDAYAVRVANVWQRQAARGEPLSLQAARRGESATARARAFYETERAKGRRTAPGGIGLEHPRSRWVGPVDKRGRPDTDTGVGYYAKQYKRPSAARAYADRLAADRIQVLVYGTPASGYADATGEVWRVVFTGQRDRCPWAAITAGYATYDGSGRVLAFDRISRIEVRDGSYIG